MRLQRSVCLFLTLSLDLSRTYHFVVFLVLNTEIHPLLADNQKSDLLNQNIAPKKSLDDLCGHFFADPKLCL